MTWPGVAAPHIRHRMELKGLYDLRCLDCSVTLLIHRESGLSTPQPPAVAARALSRITQAEA